MSDAVLKTIEILEMEIEAIDQRRGEMVKAIDSLRPLVGDAPVHRTRRAGRRGKPGPKPGRRKKAAKKTDGRTDGRSKVRASAQRGASLIEPSRSLPDRTASDVVVARDAAILRELKKGTRAFAALCEVMPTEPGQTEEQRSRACSNALTRLRLKKEIRATDNGEWELAG